MVKYILSLLIFVSCAVPRQASTSFQCSLLNDEIKSFKFDVFGNLYTIDLRNRLKIYDADFNLLFEYYNNILGEIRYVDVTNPKKIMVFFDGFQKVIFLDDTLSEIGRYEGGYNILAVGSSRDNNMWIYDGLDYRVKKISSNGRVLLESNPLESYHSIDVNPDYIIEYDNMVYMIEEGMGVVILDNFGNYSNFMEIDGLSSLVLKDRSLLYIQNNMLMQKLLDNSFEDSKKIKAIPVETEIAFTKNSSLFFLEENCLKIVEL